MPHVYKDAWLVIAAVSTADNDASFLHPRDAQNPTFRMMVWTKVNHQPLAFQLHFRRKIEAEFAGAYPGGLSYEDLPDQTLPLDNRGWTLQEMTLASRLLRVDSKQMIWVCVTKSLSERSSRRLKGEAASARIMYKERDSVPTSHTFDEERGRQGEVHKRWANVIEAFSRRRLMFESDKLPAISGLAAVQHDLSPTDQYIAGLWKPDLSRGLLLGRPGLKNDELTTPLVYRSPSFSWASVDGPVDFPIGLFLYRQNPSYVQKLEIRAIDVKPSGPHRYGHFQKGGGVVVRGYLHLGQHPLTGVGKSIYVNLDFPDAVSPGSYYELLQVLQLSVLPPAPPATHGIVIKPATKDSYKRIGRFRMLI